MHLSVWSALLLSALSNMVMLGIAPKATAGAPPFGDSAYSPHGPVNESSAPPRRERSCTDPETLHAKEVANSSDAEPTGGSEETLHGGWSRGFWNCWVLGNSETEWYKVEWGGTLAWVSTIDMTGTIRVCGGGEEGGLELSVIVWGT